MDPLALSGALASLVGLLCNFKAERSGTQLSEFIDWLREQHHDQFLAKIEADARLTQELKVLLAMKHENLATKLTALTEQISIVAQQIDGFASIAAYLAPSSALSDQAWSILDQLVASAAEYALEISVDGGSAFVLPGSRGGEIKVSEQIFVGEDVDALQLCGFIRVEHTAQKSRKLVPTRLGYAACRRRDA